MKKEIQPKYLPKDVERGKYDFWVSKEYFVANKDSSKPPYAIVIPPPNVTGKLHLGHAWDNTLQDIIIRYKKLQGFDTLYLPGMDHAGIATQSKVEERLRKEQKLLRQDLGRDNFIKQVWSWKEEYAAIIRNQWAKLGLALDYSKERFTLDQELSNNVVKVFVDLYIKGIIYRGKRIISWDPMQQTALSNIEVIYKEVKGKMYYFKYYLLDSEEYLVVATTRPETMFADQCLVINPNDERYIKYHNKSVINPANNKVIPIICDDYVDMNFGSGVMKCTPAHDPNDFEIALRHNLEMPICMNLDGSLNDLAHKYAGLDRFEARKELVKDLEEANLVEKIEEYIHQVGFSERSDTIVEPYLSNQWFVKMQDLANNIINWQSTSNKVEFYPSRFNDTLLQWMNNIQDWCISRQLWWGHQIPAWYNKNNQDEIYVGITPPQDLENWVQDDDVLDTWFSSALWPLSTLGWNWDDDLFNRYYPTNVLVTGYDIIFFWVSRMMFQSLEFVNKKPFDDVLIHGLIRDEQGRKMSKSLGNGIDPMDVIDNYGADTLRHFLVSNSSPGQDLRYSLEKIEASWSFINKLWNATRYVLMSISDDFQANEEFLDSSYQFKGINNKWILSEFSSTLSKVCKDLENYEFVMVSKELQDFVWNKYCSWFLELAKINLQTTDQELISETQHVMYYLIKQILIVLHPYIPFVTEELYSHLDQKESIMLENYPAIDFESDNYVIEQIIDIVTAIRDFRQTKNIAIKTPLKINLIILDENDYDKLSNHKKLIDLYLLKLNNVIIENILNKVTINPSFSIPTKEVIVEILNNDLAKNEEEIRNLKEQINKLESEIKRSTTMLNNPNFLNKAKPEKINEEKDKYENYLRQYNELKERLEKSEGK